MKILGNVGFSEQIFYRKQSLGAPEMYVLQMKQVKKNFNAKLFSWH